MRVQTAQEAFVAALFILQNQGAPDPLGGLDDDETGCVLLPLGTWAVPQQLRGPAGWLCPGGQDPGLGFVISREVTLLLGKRSHITMSSTVVHVTTNRGTAVAPGPWCGLDRGGQGGLLLCSYCSGVFAMKIHVTCVFKNKFQKR